jgi:DNA-binding transcriptional MerR regulator
MSAIEIPNKASFKIGEVAELLSLEAYVLRYWETEFDQLKPRKTRTGQRAYARKDVELLLEIKRLLYEEMYTIAGARKQLEASRKKSVQPGVAVSAQEDSQLVGELSGLRTRARELEMANQQLQSSLDVAKSQLVHSNGRAEEVRAELVAVRAEGERAQLTIMDQREEIEALQARVQELEHIDETLLFLPNANDESTRLQAEVDGLQAEVGALRARIFELEAMAADSSESDALRIENETLRERVASLEAELAGVLQNQVARQQARRSALSLVRRELEQLNRLAVG